MSKFSAILWREQVTFDEMIMMSALNQINTVPSQPVFALTP